MRTPISDVDKKLDIIDHVNQDHRAELLLLTQVFTPHEHAQVAEIKDIYEEGVLLSVGDAQALEDAFVPFQLNGELEEQILYLAFLAASRRGKVLGRGDRRFFTVCGRELLSENILRIEISSAAALPEQQPGYAYWFVLKTLQSAPQQAVQRASHGWWAQLSHRAMLWTMKRLSPQRREKMMHKMSEGGRYYTLRRSWRSSEAVAFADRGQVDVFLHGDSPGSRWARSLHIGDVIFSQAETADKHEHLAHGQAVLIADETAYPALAALLETWQNPLPAHVLILSAAESEQAYFSEQRLAGVASVTRVVAAPDLQAQAAIAALDALPSIEVAWGALEDQAAKSIRHHLRHARGLSGKNNRVRAYWRAQRLGG